MAQLFDKVVIYLPSSLAPVRVQQLSHLIESHGGTVTRSVDDATVTHVVTNSHRFEGWQSFQGENSRPVCTVRILILYMFRASDILPQIQDKWVERSAILGKLQATSNYSADPRQLFSGVVGCAADLSPSDIEILSAGISSFGGYWRSGLTKDVTHLFTLGSDSEKYQNALDYKKDVPINVLLPHWFDDVLRLGMGNLDIAPYEWPDPLVLQPNTPSDNDRKKKSHKFELNKEVLFSTASWNAEAATTKIASPKQVFGRRRVLLSSSLELGERRRAIESFVERADGEIIPLENSDGDGDMSEEAQKVLDCDIFVTRFRSGTAYYNAARAGKTIASMSWIFHVLSIGILSPPMDQLLHYPIHKNLIEGFSSHEITITNFTGGAREYIKKLVCSMGAKFTPNMSSKNTVLIAAQTDGTKADRARAWGIPIVNHLWLEDCFINWKNMTVGNDRYIHFPQGSDFAPRLGERGVDPNVEDPDELDRLEEEEAEQEAEDELKQDEEPVGATINGGRSRTQDSARDAREAADIVMGADDDRVVGQTNESHPMDIDVDPEHVPTKRTPRTPNSNKSRPSPKSRAVTRKDDEEDDNFEIPSTKLPKKSSAKLSSHYFRIETEEPQMDSDHHHTSEKENRHESDDEVEDKELEKPNSSKKKSNAGDSNKPKGRRRISDAADSPESEDGLEADLPKPTKTTRSKAKPNSIQTAAKRTRYASDNKPKELNYDDASEREAGLNSDDNNRVGPPKKKRPQSSKQKTAKSNDLGGARDASEAEDSDTPHRETVKAKAALTVSVVIPGLGKSTESAGPSPSKTIAKSSSIHVASAERRSRPSNTRADPFDSPASRRPSRRAAERASQQLRDTIMPDLVKYESEMKKHRRQSSSSVSFPRDFSEDDEEGKLVGKGKGKAKSEEGQAVINARKRKASSVDAREAEESHTPAASPPKKIKKRKPGSVRVMTTQVNLTDASKKAMENLGAKFVTKPSECTHLIATKITRTEKFLCALAVSPWILTDQWIHQSVAAKTLLSEEPFFLKDRGKWDIDLKQSLEEAKKLKYPLLASRVFYVTPGVKENRSLLNHIITAFGGKMVACMPNERQLLSNGKQIPMRHLLTCEDDRKLWEPIAKDAYIHNIELLLQGVLNQFMDFDNPKFHIEGTCNND
ncbi:hypothetical protein F5890DRAFT_975129 [Lentinula detonsa]|uniref:BRCT domain-containing protein n=1 Tax=Lentinula detonsa TaxID=2804962 RepID=A0AA38UWW4_9AGAR|nr:hypothetical protein F5890DRAFT_975129 [Lentinula detonsa]